MNTLSRLVKSVNAFRRELSRTPSLPVPPPPQAPKIGLALGGGFARGLSHVGILKVLEEENIPVSYIAGTSVGAVIGAAYCSGISAKELEEIAGIVRFGDFARWTLSRFGIASNDRMNIFLHKLLKCKTFEQLRIPLAVTATDFNSGEGVAFTSGELCGPVRASCAYPGMFLPVNVNGRLLVDGLLAHSVPTSPLREMGAEKVIAIYLRSHWSSPTGPRHLFDVIGQCFSIAQDRMCPLWHHEADVILEPNVAGFAYDAFDRAPELIRAGEEAARAALPKIREWIPKVEVAPETAKVSALPAMAPAPSNLAA